LIQGDNAREYSLLKEAIFVLKCLSEGQGNQDIANTLEVDERRVSLWIDFAKDTHLLDQYHSGKWLVSDKGKSWVEEANKEELSNGLHPLY
jgi:hypothetical protein